jgi:spore coat protein JC
MRPAIPSKSNGAFKQVQLLHLVRFGEGLRLAKEKMDQKNLYFVNPSFDQ